VTRREPDSFARAEDLFDRQHSHCEAPWECHECGRRVCPRCEPSPAEFRFCAECADFGGAA
jgi:hypothetical protein